MKKSLLNSFKIISFILIINNYSYCLEGHLFKPLTANILEPRIGTVYQFNEKKLRLDIGTTIDLLEFNSGEKSKIRLGADFFTLSRLRSEGNLKFPVETSDYFFGINATSNGKIFNLDYSARLRLAHISSHIVDGLADDTILNRKPFVYSREFAELTGALNFEQIRIYAGITYVFSRQPKTTNPVIPEIGFDCRYNIFQFINLLAGYDFKLTGFDNKYFSSHSAQAGIEFETTKDIYILISCYIYDGKSIHGMFYKENESYFGIGFQVIY